MLSRDRRKVRPRWQGKLSGVSIVVPAGDQLHPIALLQLLHVRQGITSVSNKNGKGKGEKKKKIYLRNSTIYWRHQEVKIHRNTATMSEKITAENLLENLVDTFVEKQKSVPFFEGEKSDSVSSQINRLFGRQKPVHHILGGGKCMFLWSNASGLFNSAPSNVSRLVLPEELFGNIATVVGGEVNRGLRFLQDVACGGNLKQFVIVVGSLFAGAVIGSWCNFISVIYIGFVAAHTLPVLYEKYEDEVDNFVYKVLDQMLNHYQNLDASVLSKIPKGKLKGKKHEWVYPYGLC
ncbi:Reticulon protein B8 [Spatholobus suberectus]|nr:Reticulon protein B8 [Spatholobus suberectus]